MTEPARRTSRLPRDALASPAITLATVALASLLFGLRAGSAPSIALATALLALVAAALAWSRIGAASATAVRRVAARAFEDERVEVRFAVENRGALPLVGLEVADLFPADRVYDRRATIFPALPPLARVEARYLADCDAKRGIYPVGPVSVVASDPLGLFETRREIGQVERILVYPGVFEIARLERATGGTRYDAAARLAGLAGAGIEFLGTREYRPGDPLRFVHWASSARAGRLIVKEMEETAAAEVAVFLDLSRLAMRGLGRLSTVEYAVKVAASVAAHVARGPTRVRVHGRAKAPLEVAPGSGQAHVATILEALALVRADGETPFPVLLRETAGALPKGAVAVAIFGSLELDLADYAEVLALYRARGVHLVAVLIDARSFVKIFDEQIEHERAAPRTGDVVGALVGEGATVYTIARGDDLARRFDAPVGAFGGGAGLRSAGRDGEADAAGADDGGDDDLVDLEAA